MKLKSILIMVGVLVVLGAAFLIINRPKPQPPAQPRQFVWQVEMEQLAAMAISLPHEKKREAWVRHTDKYWYFDTPNGQMVNMKRWGGGIPLLLSGPGANRLIATNATSEELRMYGLADPLMKIKLTLDNKRAIDIDVGDKTPGGEAYYIKLASAKDVYTVDYTWFDVLARLVREPPYPEAGG
jgi:hypothetical protein